MKFYSTVKNTELSFTDLVCTNSKLDKAVIGHSSKIVGLPLAPSGSSGRNVCQHSTEACRAACVTWFAGRKVMASVRNAAIARTMFFFEHQDAFFGLLRAELGIELAKAQMANERLYFRPNESSDIPWERFSDFPWMTSCYDYSAIHSRVLKSLAWDLDYQLTLSIKETTTVSQARSVLDNGGNVACVVDTVYNPQQRKYGILPSVVSIGGKEYQTVDGDVHDLRRREIDGCGKVVLLRLKGTNAAKHEARSLGFAKTIENLGTANTLQRSDSGSVLSLN
ncbi:MAG: hypothetical protein ACK5S6_01905 [bacterium]|jgi:hypothetical protein